MNKRTNFGTTLGAIATLAGSAVGLGNIWKFPYIVGENGGGAFILLYIVFILLIGFPVMLAELSIGRHAQKNAIGAFRTIAPNTKWFLMGVFSIVISILILSYYSTVSGWTLEYIFLSLKGEFNATGGNINVESIYNDFISSPFKVLLSQFLFIAITAAVIILGVKKGIEKFSKIMMPILFLILIALGINAICLPAAKEGLNYLFIPRFDQLTSESVIAALGQSFFSLSVGMGVLLTYSSYLKKSESLVSISLKVIAADTIVAILAGVAIIPAVFNYGLELGAGPGLVFITLPQVFSSMPGGVIWAVLFFILLAFAALTSTISLLEVPVSYAIERFKVSRGVVTCIIALLIFGIGIFNSISFNILKDVSIFGLSIFEAFDYLCSNILMPMGGIFMCIFAGWYLKSTFLIREVGGDISSPSVFIRIYVIILRYIAPISIFMVMLNALNLF